jgi:competence protein ComEC
LLVDAGGAGPGFDIANRVVVPAVWALGVRRLDWLAITHADLDHIGGALGVMRTLRPREVWEGVPVPRSQEREAARVAARRDGVVWRTLRDGHRLETGGVGVEVRHPPAPDWERQRVRNDDSLVLAVTYGEVEVLLTGDAGEEFERRPIAAAGRDARLRVLKVGHHGSRTSSAPFFVDAYRPAVALISAGRGNLFGHPAPDVEARLLDARAEVFRTDVHGAIQVETDGRRLEIETISGRRRGVFLWPSQ